MFGTVTSPVPVKRYQSIPVRDMHLPSKFGKLSFSTRRNMTDRQNHMILSILCHNTWGGMHLDTLDEMYLLSKFSDCTSFRKGDVLDCQSHVTMWLWRHYHLLRNVTVEDSSLTDARLSKFGGFWP